MGRVPATERRRALIEAALRVVSRDGIAQATTRAIVAEAGMSLASFHYVFESRDALIDALIATMIEREQRALHVEPCEGDDLRGLLMRGFDGYVDHLTHHPEHEQAMLELAQYALRSPDRHQLAVDLHAKYRALAVELLEACAEATGSRWLQPIDDIARALVALSDGLTIGWLVDRDDAAARAVARAAADAIASMAEPR